MPVLAKNHPVAVAVTAAIHTGDLPALRALLAADPELATSRVDDGRCERSLLHLATDWPGDFPNQAGTIRCLLAAGAEVNARMVGPHTETPLHWAASNDNVAVLDLLLDSGADLEADGGVIGGGTPLADATAFAQWRAAHRLVERGARTSVFDAAALGLTDRLPESLPQEELNEGFWAACHGGQRAAAELLLGRGAEVNWVSPWDGLTPLEAAERSKATELLGWLRSVGARRGG